MKTTKRLIAMAAALTLTACAAAPITMMNVSAANDNTITITSTEGYTLPEMAAYQVFKGTYASEKLTVTGWGADITATQGSTLLNTLQSNDVFKKDGSNIFSNITATGDALAVAIADTMTSWTNNSDMSKEFARILRSVVSGNGQGTWDSENKKFTGLEDGYYIVREKGNAAVSNGSNSVYSLAMLQVAGGNATATLKVGLPTFEKNILDTNDSVNRPNAKDDNGAFKTGTVAEGETYGTWGKSADYDIGDEVPFQLVATLPDNYDKYKTYTLTFHDNIQDGKLAYKTGSLTVYALKGGVKTPITGGFSITTPTTDNTNTAFSGFSGDETENLTVTFSNLKEITSIDKGTSIVVEYTATLLDSCVIGNDGNWNGAYLEYSKNPNYTGTGTEDKGTTPEDTVVAFTYKTVINKVDGRNNTALTGAEFKLEKKVINADGTEGWVEKGHTESTPTAVFTFKGLDDGYYRLTETTTPTDYNGLTSAIEFEVSATHEKSGITALTGTAKTGTIALSSDTAFSTLTGTIENFKGSTLPTTGGTGTKVLYAIGGTILVGAGMVLVSKKRAQK